MRQSRGEPDVLDAADQEPDGPSLSSRRTAYGRTTLGVKPAVREHEVDVAGQVLVLEPLPGRAEGFDLVVRRVTCRVAEPAPDRAARSGARASGAGPWGAAPFA